MRTFTADILSAPAPVEKLQHLLEQLEREQEHEVAAALYEDLLWRIDLRDYVVFHILFRVYSQLGRADAAYLIACQAAQMHPDWNDSSWPFRTVFEFLLRHRPHSAVDVYFAQIEACPERPLITKVGIQPVLNRLGLSLEQRETASRESNDRINHRVVEAERREGKAYPVFGKGVPFALRELAQPMFRQAIDVAELTEAELLVYRDCTVAIGRYGNLHDDLSVCDFPELVRRKFKKAEEAGEPIDQFEVEDAVVLIDHFPGPNLSHFLLDQISRFELYRRADVDIERSLVISPRMNADYIGKVFEYVGAKHVYDASKAARVHAKRLWVSSNCKALQHAGHFGANWVTKFLRDTLGHPNQKGSRRLIISRADAGARVIVNEPEIAELLKPYGFELIVPGQMRYEDQVAAFREASHVVAPHGAALAHIVLCPAGAQVLEIFHPRYSTASFAMQAEAADIRYAAMVGKDAGSDSLELNDASLVTAHDDHYVRRNIRVDLDVLQSYLTTIL